jgi:hypothetical protein
MNRIGLMIDVSHPSKGSMMQTAALSKAPIIASSAKAGGSNQPTRAEDVREQLDGRIDLIVDGGPTRYKKGSTIVAVNGQGFAVKRAGVFDERTVRRLASWTILSCTNNTCRSPITIKSCAQSGRIGCRGSDWMQAFCKSAGPTRSRRRAVGNSVAVCQSMGIDLRPSHLAVDPQLIQSATQSHDGQSHLRNRHFVAQAAARRRCWIDGNLRPGGRTDRHLP